MRKPERPRSESRPHRVGVIRHRTDFSGKSAPGLGPPRSIQYRESGDCLSVQTVDRDVVLPRPLTQQGGWADSRLDGRGISLRPANLSIRKLVYPDPFLGSSAFYRSLPTGSSVLGPTQRYPQRLSPRGPRASLAATLTRLASFGVLAPISSGWPRRWPPTSAVPAIGCFARPNSPFRSRTPCQEPFPLSPAGFPSDDEGNYTRRAAIHREISTLRGSLIHRRT